MCHDCNHGLDDGRVYRFDPDGELLADEPDVMGVGVPGPHPRAVPGPATVQLPVPGPISGPVLAGPGSVSVGTIGPALLSRPCSFPVLNGSWLIEFTRSGPAATAFNQHIRGPMRIEVQDASLRISGDIYVRRLRLVATSELVNPTVVLAAAAVPTAAVPTAPDSTGDAATATLTAGPITAALPGLAITGETLTSVVGPNGAPLIPSYPQLPMSQYSWYFRSTGVTYSGGTLSFSLVRHVWNRTSKEFSSEDVGSMTLSCRRSVLVNRNTPATMTGTATIGHVTYAVSATKTSNLYRGCAVEVDVMTGRTWPSTAVHGGAVRTFTDIYAADGWDMPVRLDELTIPDDASLTVAELETLLTAHRGAATSADQWRLWLLVGSTQGGLLGLMFDDDSVPREGSVGFADATFGNQDYLEPGARGRPLDEVPDAFLRTLVHEAGHALNLFHPKHDIHNPPIGTEIMNQTGDVMGFASPTNQYPGNATLGFASHDHDSLIHSPDPQVRPGWKNFGWGHGDLSAGLPTPVDAAGLTGGDDDDDLVLTLELPGEMYVGEYVTAAFTLTNTGPVARSVPRLNLAEGYLRLSHVLPDGSFARSRDVVVACGSRPSTVLEPGGSLTARAQVFYTSEGVTFDRSGKHILRAFLDLDEGTTVRSDRASVWVRTPSTPDEVTIASTMLDPAVGRALALGDFGQDLALRNQLDALAQHHSATDSGAAAALVLANALARGHSDHRRGSRREPEPEQSAHYLELAAQGRSPSALMRLAVTVASPIEAGAPVVAQALARASGEQTSAGDTAAAAPGDAGADGVAAGSGPEQLMADFMAAAP